MSQTKNQLGETVPERYVPGASFDAERFKSFGAINFLSTKGFLAGLAKAALVYDGNVRVAGQRTRHILAANEAESTAAFDAAYRNEIILAVQKRGLARVYNKTRDRSLADMQAESDHESVAIADAASAPWMSYMTSIAKGTVGLVQKALLKTQILDEFMLFRSQEASRAFKLHYAEGEQILEYVDPKKVNDVLLDEVNRTLYQGTPSRRASNGRG